MKLLVVSKVNKRGHTESHTFHKLLASILLVEGLVADRTSKIIDHKLKHGFYLFFRVSGIVGDGGVLIGVRICYEHKLL